MPRGVNHNTKYRLSMVDAAFALSLRIEKIGQLVANDILIARGGKVLKSDIEKLLDAVYAHDFPNNIKDMDTRRILITTFCKGKEISNYINKKGA